MEENKICFCKGDNCTCAYGKSATKITDALIVVGSIAFAFWFGSKLLNKN